MNTAEQGQNTGVRHFFEVVRRRKWVLILVLLLIPLLAVFLSLKQQKLYQSSAEVLVGQQDLAATLAGVPNPDLYADPARILQTQAEIARSPVVVRNTLRAGGAPGRSVSVFLASSTVSPKPNVDLLRFSVTDENPSLARSLANGYARQYIRRHVSLETAALTTARRELERQIEILLRTGGRRSPVYATLIDRQQQLKTMEALKSSDLSIVHPAGAAIQVQPRPVRNGVLGAILGLVLGLALVFLWEALDTRMRHADEVSRRLGLPLLARIPRLPRRQRNSRPTMLDDPRGSHAEPYRILRTNLEFMTLGSPAQVIMVTSALGQEGKTTTASNLAVSLARTGRRVALVDFDLRRPRISEMFGLHAGPGATDVALGRASLEDALVAVGLTGSIEQSDALAQDGALPSRNGRGSHEGVLRVLPSGPPPPDPGEFVGSRAVADIISRLREMSDIVLIDTPPLLHLGDAMTLSGRVDGIVIVVSLDATRRPTLNELHRVLEACPARKLGFALAGVEPTVDYGYAGYYQEQRDQADKERQEEMTAT